MDLVEITDFIALDSPERADQFEHELLQRAQKIALAPLGYIWSEPNFAKDCDPAHVDPM
jgi:plasmid stabilization system protein ParE